MDITNDDEALRALLGHRRRIAVVGASPERGRPSNNIFRFLVDAGHDVIPVNPMAPEIEGVVPAKSIAEATARWGAVPEIVDVFRQPAHLPQVVHDAVAQGTENLWCQLGVVHEEAIKDAQDAGMATIVDRCILVESQRLGLTQVH